MPNELRVVVHAARNVIGKDDGGKSSDPFCVVKVGSAKLKTKVCERTLNPVSTTLHQHLPRATM